MDHFILIGVSVGLCTLFMLLSRMEMFIIHEIIERRPARDIRTAFIRARLDGVGTVLFGLVFWIIEATLFSEFSTLTLAVISTLQTVAGLVVWVFYPLTKLK